MISDDPHRWDALREVVAACAPEVARRPLVPEDDGRVRLAAQGLGLQLAARAGDSILLWLVPSARGDQAETGETWRVNQAVLDLPAGRYVIDVFSIPEGRRISREVATAPPLVIGLPDRGEPLLACIDRVAPMVRISGDTR